SRHRLQCIAGCEQARASRRRYGLSCLASLFDGVFSRSALPALIAASPQRRVTLPDQPGGYAIVTPYFGDQSKLDVKVTCILLPPTCAKHDMVQEATVRRAAEPRHHEVFGRVRAVRINRNIAKGLQQ